MPHLHTQPGQYDLTASAYIVRLDGTEPALLLHKHKKLGVYLQFGGHVELHESPWAAVVHEIAEESGYAISQLKILQPPIKSVQISSGILHPFPVATLSVQFGDTDHFHTDIAYAFVTHELPQDALHEGESASIKAFTAAGLAALQAEEIPRNVRETGRFTLEECLPHWSQADTAAFTTANPA